MMVSIPYRYHFVMNESNNAYGQITITIILSSRWYRYLIAIISYVSIRFDTYKYQYLQVSIPSDTTNINTFQYLQVLIPFDTYKYRFLPIPTSIDTFRYLQVSIYRYHIYTFNVTSAHSHEMCKWLCKIMCTLMK